MEDGAFCKHCGARVLRPKDVGADTDHRTSPERFELAEKHPGFGMARSHMPKVSATAEVVAPIVLGGFGVLFIIISQSIGGEVHEPTGFRLLFLAIPIIFICVAIAMVIKAMRFASAPISNDLLVVVDERIEVKGGGENSSAHTTYYATLQDRRGARHEYQTYDWLAGRIAAGDIGVAYLKGGRLVDFSRLDIR